MCSDVSGMYLTYGIGPRQKNDSTARRARTKGGQKGFQFDHSGVVQQTEREIVDVGR